MAITNKSTNNKCWRGCGEEGTRVHCWWECRLVQPLWKILWNFIKKLKIELLGLHPKNPETPIQKILCTPMLISAQFTIAKCWKQPKCPSVNKWIKNCGTFTQWNTMQQKERRNSYPSQQHGPGKNYAKWYKPGSERQIPYDLTFKWNLINKTNKQAKYNQRHWN